MFERFTDRARRVVVLAQEEARMLNHNYIGTEHILLGLIDEDEGVAAKALESLGISRKALRQQVKEIIGQGQQPPGGHIPFTRRAKKVVELAQDESETLGHGFIDTDHLLIGLIREGDGVAAQVLVQLGADLGSARRQVALLLPRRPATVSAQTRLGKRERARLIDDTLARVGPMDRRLAAIERWIGMTPDVSDIDREIAHVRHEKESAIDSQDFETAAALRDKEKELIDHRSTREEEWTATADARPSLAAQLSQVNAELEHLRNLLRQHGIDSAG
jgi:ATP-dependent Clp protease ATP-binding subunit ClpA